MVLDFAKQLYSEEKRKALICEINRINNLIKPETWSDESLEAFMLGYKLGVYEK